ncbi:MAG: response regulator [Oscillatoriales cyanobacterium SM2_1_8]|nr:response regulator [Oscillatoriales cyanobacterium SM2_1_8]
MTGRSASSFAETPNLATNRLGVLIVDDELEVERLFRQRFRRQLRESSYEFLFAHSGIEALRVLDEVGPRIRLVMTDINMPEMDGLTLLAKLQERDRSLRAIVISAYGDLGNIRTAMNRGAFDFLTKPIDFQDLEITLNRTLASIRELQEQEERLQQARTQLLQYEKMASLGNLMAGVAHEIKNPINFIQNNLPPAKEYLDEMAAYFRYYQSQLGDEGAIANDLDFALTDFRKILDGMELGANLLVSISGTLRNFARTDAAAPTAVLLEESVEGVLLILSYRLKAAGRWPGVNVVRQYHLIEKVPCYPSQINQALMNILGNAIDAMEEAYTKGLMGDRRPQLTVHVYREGDRAAIAISDNGLGMTPETQQRLFEPLFTTKPVGKGTGLGMAICRQIIYETHRGEIQCQSVWHQGTTFTVYLPLAGISP